jgi:uncharacterized protein (TIGR00369 family)
MLERPIRSAAECRAHIQPFNSAPYYRLLGITADSEAPGTSRVSLPFDPKLTQLYGAVHGGVVATIADSSIMVAVMTMLAEDEGLGTVELSIHFLTPAGQSDLVAEGRVTRLGNKIGFGECVIRAGEREVARAQGIAAIVPRAKVDRTLK